MGEIQTYNLEDLKLPEAKGSAKTETFNLEELSLAPTTTPTPTPTPAPVEEPQAPGFLEKAQKAHEYFVPQFHDKKLHEINTSMMAPDPLGTRRIMAGLEIFDRVDRGIGIARRKHGLKHPLKIIGEVAKGVWMGDLPTGQELRAKRLEKEVESGDLSLKEFVEKTTGMDAVAMGVVEDVRLSPSTYTLVSPRALLNVYHKGGAPAMLKVNQLITYLGKHITKPAFEKSGKLGSLLSFGLFGDDFIEALLKIDPKVLKKNPEKALEELAPLLERQLLESEIAMEKAALKRPPFQIAERQAGGVPMAGSAQMAPPPVSAQAQIPPPPLPEQMMAGMGDIPPPPAMAGIPVQPPLPPPRPPGAILPTEVRPIGAVERELSARAPLSPEVYSSYEKLSNRAKFMNLEGNIHVKNIDEVMARIEGQEGNASIADLYQIREFLDRTSKAHYETGMKSTLHQELNNTVGEMRHALDDVVRNNFDEYKQMEATVSQLQDITKPFVKKKASLDKATGFGAYARMFKRLAQFQGMFIAPFVGTGYAIAGKPLAAASFYADAAFMTGWFVSQSPSFWLKAARAGRGTPLSDFLRVSQQGAKAMNAWAKQNPGQMQAVVGTVLALSKSELEMRMGEEYGVRALTDDLTIPSKRQRYEYAKKLMGQMAEEGMDAVDQAKAYQQIMKTGQIYDYVSRETPPIKYGEEESANPKPVIGIPE